MRAQVPLTNVIRLLCMGDYPTNGLPIARTNHIPQYVDGAGMVVDLSNSRGLVRGPTGHFWMWWAYGGPQWTSPAEPISLARQTGDSTPVELRILDAADRRVLFR